ncbi:MFS transporter [Nocardioides terrisoli]|uniref:MFS transporter n=1 Tax=Nocardioides terrisoli TaxID=3388267 RepID=UPI00287BA526|nr:MFS transporter [Nocardioides marmorisolisilvae]
MRQAFALPGFRRLFVAMSTSMFGDAVMLLVLSMWVKSLTGSNGRAGFTFFWMVLPALFAPAYGIFLDRFRRRPMLVWSTLASALVLLPLLLVRDAGDVWIIYAVAFCYGISFVVVPASLNGLLKEMLPDETLVEANSSLQTVKEGYRLIGPLIGAGLFGWIGGGAVAVVDAASFLVAAAVIATLRVPEERPERSTEHWWAEMTGGVRHLVHEPVLKHVVAAFAITLFVLGYIEASIYALLDFYDKPVTFAGVIVTMQGIGAIAGGLTTSRWVRRLGEPGTVAVGLALLATSVLAIALTSTLAVVLVAVVLCGYSLPMLFVAFTTLLQRRTPQRLMGRVSAAAETLMGTPQAISLAVGAGLVAVLDFHVIFGVIGGVTALASAYLVVTLRSSLWAPQPVPVDSAVAVAAPTLER